MKYVLTRNACIGGEIIQERTAIDGSILRIYEVGESALVGIRDTPDLIEIQEADKIGWGSCMHALIGEIVAAEVHADEMLENTFVPHDDPELDVAAEVIARLFIA